MADQDVTELLDDRALALLREGYDAEAMAEGARRSLVGPYPPAAPLVEFILGRFYVGRAFRADRRELVLISFFASQHARRSLAIHLYWGLMEGLTVAEVAETLLLVGAYAGIDTFNGGVGVLRELLERVLVPAARDGGDAARTGAIVRALAQTFA